MSKIYEKKLNRIEINWGRKEDILIGNQKLNLLEFIVNI